MGFYGLGESFVFKFEENEKIEVFRFTGANDKIQFSNEKCIIIGGGDSR